MKWTLRVAVVQAFALAATVALALDIYAHKRVEDLGGVNVWGYRGPVAARRQPNEIRIVVVGGTRAFGWGLPASSLVAEVRRLVMLTTDRPGAEPRPVVVISLGRMGALPESYPETIEHYSYLRPDYICLYDDLGVSGRSPAPDTGGASAVFQLTGYAPALPLVLREKGMVWRFGDVQSGYVPPELRRGRSTSLVRSAAGSLLEGVGATLAAADRGMARILARRDSTARRADAADYADAMMKAIDAAHRVARGVVVVVSPSETARQAVNRRALDARLAAPPGDAPWLRVVDLGADPRLAADLTLRIDDWNYASAGVALIAGRIAPALLSLIPLS